jgi:hypothetical protein
MTYFILQSTGRPHQFNADLDPWRKKIGNISRCAEISMVWRNGRALLKLEEMPESLELEGKPKKLLDVFFSDNGIVLCSPRVKDVIEELDPGLHQFIPIRLFWQKAKDVELDYRATKNAATCPYL